MWIFIVFPVTIYFYIQAKGKCYGTWNISVIIYRSDVTACNKNRESECSTCTASAASVVVTADYSHSPYKHLATGQGQHKAKGASK